MIVDIHTHITSQRLPGLVKKTRRRPFPLRTLLYRMDMEGIDRSVLLPLGNPENQHKFQVADNIECIKAARRHPDRIMTFCNLDPRSLRNTSDAESSKLLALYKDEGALGIGEVCANLSFTDPLCKKLFHHAGEMKMPVLFHVSGRKHGLYGLLDKPGLTGLEECLREFPKTLFIGHAPAFWNEIDGNLKPGARDHYPKGVIRTKGRLWRLLDKYPNLYGDVSAGSGYNALSRDPLRGLAFLKRYHRKLFFGTDRFSSRNEPPPPILAHIKEARSKRQLTKREYEAIMFRNFRRVFGV